MAFLNAMRRCLVSQQYLRMNPFTGLPAAPSVTLDAIGRTHTRAQCQFVMQNVLRPVSAFDASGEPATDAATTARDAFLLLFAYATGSRRAEIAGAFDDAWGLRVMGKGWCAYGIGAEGAPTSSPPHRSAVAAGGAVKWQVIGRPQI